MDDIITAEQILEYADALRPGANLGCKLSGNTIVCAVSNVLDRLADLDEETKAKVADWLRWLPLVGADGGQAGDPEPPLPPEVEDIRDDLATVRDACRSSFPES